MPDFLDALTEREAILDALPKTKPTPKFEPRCSCYNCDAIIPLPKLYCDGDCASEHDWILKRQKEHRV